VEKMMEIVIENAGAERGYLLQYDGDKLLIQAKGKFEVRYTGASIKADRETNNKLSLAIVNPCDSKQRAG